MKFRTLCIAAAFAAAPAAALAMGSGAAAPAASSVQPAMPKSPLPKFKQADTNHDGKIEWNEAKADGVSQKLFKRDDFNHDGTLNKTEWMFVRLDSTDFKSPAPGTGG